MRILFTRFPLESSFGGAEVQTLSLMEGLLRRGHAVAFLGGCPVLLSECRKRGIPAAELHIGPPPVTKWHALSFFWRKRKMKARLLAALSEMEHLDALCMLSLSEKLLATQWMQARGVKILWIEHDRVGRWLTKNPWLLQLKALSSKATTVGVSELSKRLYEELGFQHVVAIPNGIDPRRMTNENSQFSILNSQFKIGCVARLTRDKGINLLIEAIANLPDVSLTIVGQGRAEKNLRAMISSKTKNQKLKTKNSIEILPFVENLATFYRSLDILVLPSREHDPFGLVAAEAMLLGVPVIVTDACGIAGYLRDGFNALVVRANSRDALREAIHRMRDPTLRTQLATEGQRTALHAFSLSRMIDHYERLMK